jgi:hypothetical protein
LYSEFFQIPLDDSNESLRIDLHARTKFAFCPRSLEVVAS